MVKRKTVSMSRPRGTVRRHQGKSGPSREKLAQHAHLGPSRENTHPTRHKPRFLGHFPSLANYFAFAFTSDRTGRTISRPEHRDVITVKPTASLNARPGTKFSQQPPSHTPGGTKLSTHPALHALSGTKLSQHAALHAPGGTKLSQHAKIRLFLPKMHKQGEFCTARRAHELSRKSFQPNIASSPHQHR